jgi:hypothetical protein
MIAAPPIKLITGKDAHISFPTSSPTPWFGKAARDHIQEWLESAVDPGIIQLNLETLTDTATEPNADNLFPIAERLNWQITRFGRQARTTLRGWWVSGVDPFNHWNRMSWGRFKPDSNTPVMDKEKGKPARYLSPSLGAGSSRLTLLQVPKLIWQKVAERYHTPIAPEDESLGFWHWVWRYNIPLILTEGEKKAGCLLSLGYAAIALPGIFNGYRKDPLRLIAELDFFATQGRQIYICFDFETRPKVIQDIILAINKTGRLLEKAGCQVHVISLPGPEKGVDDFVVANGQENFDELYQSAQSLDYWQASRLWSLTHPPALTLNQRYLGALPFPESGLVAIKSPKGTGKTVALEPLIQAAIRQGRKVIVLTHRIQLGRAICDRLGLDWVEEMWQSETQGRFGFGLCIDSLHYQSQARFNPQHWKGAILVIDEAEQVLWHLLNSKTCFEHRVKILEAFKELVQVTLSSDGLIIAQDADLSDVSIDYLQGLAEAPIQPWVVVNDWKPEQGWNVSFYDTPNPAPLLVRLEQAIEQGAVFVTLDSQKVKGRWSSKNLESHLQQKFPGKRILRIDSETVADPNHAAYGMVEQLNQAITGYDIVIATPTIGTGVSIDVREHFVGVFGIFQGATPDAEARQALARVRDTVPRFVWAAPFGPGKVGNGSCSYRAVAQSTTKNVKLNIALLKEIDFDLDASTDPVSLRTWSKMAARVNASMWRFREELKNGLRMEGHSVNLVSDQYESFIPAVFKAHLQELSELFGAGVIEQELRRDLRRGVVQFPGFEYLSWRHPQEICEQALAEVSVVRDLNKQTEATAVIDAPDISQSEYEQLREKRAKTTVERLAERKHELQKRYGVPLTAELKLKDDEGWYSQLRLHYYLTHDPEFVRLRDIREWQGHLERGEGKIALQDIRLLTLQVESLKRLGILKLLESEREVRATDADVLWMINLCQQDPQSIKTALNLTISDAMTPMQIVQALLNKLGLKLTCVSRDQAADGKRGGLRVYQYQPPQDERQTIFAGWKERDEAAVIAAAQVECSADPPGDDPPSDIFIK